MSAVDPDYAADRKLPEGLTCAACRNGPRCDGLFGAVRRAFTTCDFWPSRFLAFETGAPAAVTAGAPASSSSGEHP